MSGHGGYTPNPIIGNTKAPDVNNPLDLRGATVAPDGSVTAPLAGGNPGITVTVNNDGNHHVTATINHPEAHPADPKNPKTAHFTVTHDELAGTTSTKADSGLNPNNSVDRYVGVAAIQQALKGGLISHDDAYVHDPDKAIPKQITPQNRQVAMATGHGEGRH